MLVKKIPEIQIGFGQCDVKKDFYRTGISFFRVKSLLVSWRADFSSFGLI